MAVVRALVIAGSLASLVGFGSGAHAQTAPQNDQGRTPANVLATTACWEPNCFVTSTAFGWPNPSPYTVFATLALPPGHYLLHGKLSAYTNSPVVWGNLECFMGTEKDRPSDWWNFTDYSSVSYNGAGQHVVPMVLAVKLATPRAMQIGCKLAGFQFDSLGQQAPIQLGVWGVRLIAERVGSPVIQLTAP